MNTLMLDMTMNLKPKDYSFLKLLVENGELSTKEMRIESEKNEGVVNLDNNAINYRIDSLGDGNSNVSGKRFIKVEKKESYGSEPKKIMIREDKREEVEELVQEYDPSRDLEDFNSVQEALSFFVEQVDKLKDDLDNVEYELQEQEQTMQAMGDQLKQLNNTIDELEGNVESHDEALNVIKNDLRPLVIGMSSELEDAIDFNPEDYLD